MKKIRFILLLFALLVMPIPISAQMHRLYPDNLMIQEKPWLDVTAPDYGAVAEDDVDDTTAIDAAIDAAASNATVFLPDGTYIFGNSTYNKSVRIVGQSKEGTIIQWKAASAEGNLFYFGTDEINVTFENLTIDGNYSNQTDSTGYYASIAFAGAAGSHLTLKNVKFVNGRIVDVIAVGTSTADPIYVDIQNCEFVDGMVGTSTRSAQHLTISETVDLNFTGNRLRSSSKPSSYGRAGLVVQRQSGSTNTYFGKVTVTDNECLNIGRGTANTLGCFDVYSGAEQVIIANNRGYTPIGRFITAKADSGNIQIIGNNATGFDGFAASLPAIVLYDSPTVPATKAKNAIIALNVLKAPVRSDNYGIFVDGRDSGGSQLFENAIISDNIIEGQWQAGIYGRYIGNTVVKNNTIVDTGAGIFFNNITGTFEASGNYIANTTENGISNNSAMTACDGIYKNNTLVNITGRAVNLAEHNSYQIEGNTVDGAAYAFYTAGSTERSTVKGNTIRAANVVWQKGGTDTNVEVKLSVLDFGATGNGTADDTAAIQANIDFMEAIGGGSVYFPSNMNFKITSTITVDSDNVILMGEPGDRAIITNAIAGGASDAIVFTTSDPDDKDTFVSGCGIFNIVITASTDQTAGAAVKVIKQSGFKVENLTTLKHPFGLDLYGNISVLANRFFLYYTSGAALVDEGALLRIQGQLNDDASYTTPWTSEFSNFHIDANQAVDYCIELNEADGMNFVNGYISDAYDSLVQIEVDHAGDSVKVVHFINVYGDGVDGSTDTGVTFENDNGTIDDIQFTNCTWANLDYRGFNVAEPDTGDVTVVGGQFRNIDAGGISINATNAKFTIVGVTFKDCRTDADGGGAVAVANADTTVISGNTFRNTAGTAAYGIIWSGTHNQGTVIGNNFTNFSSGQIGNTATFNDDYLQSGNTTDGTAINSIIGGDVYPQIDNTFYLGRNDDDSPRAWKGVILKDTSDGKYYRIQLTKGVVEIIDLTD